MKSNALIDIPAKKQRRKRKSGDHPEDVVNHLKRDFSATNPNIKWVTDISYTAAESFFGLLKREWFNRRHYVTRSEARTDIFDYIEQSYNRSKTRKLEQADQTDLH